MVINTSQFVYGFFIILTVTSNYGFVLGEIDQPDHHGFFALLFTIAANGAAIWLKIRDRSEIAGLMMASGLVAILQLTLAAAIGLFSLYSTGTAMSAKFTIVIVSLAYGGLLANLVAVTAFVANALKSQ